MACRRGSGWLLILGTLLPTVAAGQATSYRDLSANSGEDFLRPPQSLFQLMYEYETAPGSGSTPGSIGTITTDEIKLRADHRVDLSQQLALALRADLPLVAKDPINSSNPNGDYLYGVGDADTQAALIDYLDKRWTAGFGARLTAPTGGALLARENGRSCPSPVRVTSCRKSIPAAILSPLSGMTLALRVIRQRRISATCKLRRLSTSGFLTACF